MESVKDYRSEKFGTVEIRLRSVDRGPAQEVRSRRKIGTFIEIALHGYGRAFVISEAKQIKGDCHKQIPSKHSFKFFKRTRAARREALYTVELVIREGRTVVTVHAACGMDGAYAVEFEIIIGKFAVGANEKFNARILMHGRIVGVVDSTEIVAPDDKIEVDIFVGMGCRNNGERAVGILLFPVEAFDCATIAVFVELLDDFILGKPVELRKERNVKGEGSFIHV